MSVLYVLFMGLWRDCFGKGGYDIPILKWRVVQHIIGFCATFCFAYFYKDVSLFWSLYLSGIIQGLVWAGGHGAVYDIGTSGMPDEKMKERYKKTRGNKICELIFPESMQYGMIYDFVNMSLRYSLPYVLLLPVLHWFCLGTGVFIAVAYLIYRYSSSDSFFRTKRYLDPEIIAGLIVGCSVAFLC